MAKYQHHCHLIIEIPNERNGKEGAGRDVVSNILVVTKEHHLEDMAKMPNFKVWA